MLAIAIGVWQLEHARQGVDITAHRVGTMPVTVFRPAQPTGPPPVVLIAHGFAGSQQLMQPFALTLSRNGYVAITFDLPGHGRNATPMTGGLASQQESLRVLLKALGEMGAYVGQLAGTGHLSGRYALVGHSMASDIVVRHAQSHPEVQATVGVSLFAPSIDAASPPDSPRNLLVIGGGLEPQMMAAEALRVVGRVAGPTVALDQTYGRFADGTARRATLSPGVEHIGVLYSAHTLSESLAWLDAAFARPPAQGPFIDARGPWLGLLLFGVVALAWPLSNMLPRVSRSSPPTGALRRPSWRAWRRQSALALAPAVLTPLLLWKLPTDFLPLLLGDYLALHFALYGALTLAGLAWAGHKMPPANAFALVVAIALASAWALLAVGVPIDRYVFNMRPESVRLPLIAALCVGTLPYFLADEWFTRGTGAAPGAYSVSKLCFLLSLVAAIALNPQRLFFLAIIVPAILLLFVVYGLFSRWIGLASGHPAVAAVANALAFGTFIAVTFPLVA
ncbi:MAG TPA: alpha/beta fold hydrolase [Lautropia sp.]|nr:alpha/beta fold hydrolase [Lautropia sp.]